MLTTTPYNKLRIWQESRKLVADVYKSTSSFPKSETYGLTSQFRRATVSIAANITEGKGRSSSKDFANFLITAKASACEAQLYCVLSSDLGYLETSVSEKLFADLNRIIVGLENLIRHLRR